MVVLSRLREARPTRGGVDYGETPDLPRDGGGNSPRVDPAPNAQRPLRALPTVSAPQREPQMRVGEVAHVSYLRSVYGICEVSFLLPLAQYTAANRGRCARPLGYFSFFNRVCAVCAAGSIIDEGPAGGVRVHPSAGSDMRMGGRVEVGPEKGLLPRWGSPVSLPAPPALSTTPPCCLAYGSFFGVSGTVLQSPQRLTTACQWGRGSRPRAKGGSPTALPRPAPREQTADGQDELDGGRYRYQIHRWAASSPSHVPPFSPKYLCDRLWG